MSPASPPKNVGQFALDALEKLPTTWSFRYQGSNEWQSIDADQLSRLLKKAIAALIAYGIKPGDCVASYGPNRPEMFIIDLAAMSIGAMSTVFPDSAQFTQMPSFLGNAQPSLLFVNGQEHLDRLPSGRPSHIVVFSDEKGEHPHSSRFQLEHFDDFLDRAVAVGASVLSDRLQAVQGDQAAFIIYTSGTEGEPKAIVHSHRAFLGLAKQMRDEYGLVPGEVVLAFVPLCHMPARLGFLLAISEPYEPWMNPDLKTLPKIMQDARPTFLPGVPRMFERIRSTVLDRSMTTPGSVQALLHWSLTQGQHFHLEGNTDLATRIGYSMADRLVLSKIRGALGGRVHRALCGGAKVDPQVLIFFASLGIRVRETYGMTEVGAIAIQPPDVTRFGSVGKLAKGVEIQIQEDGEIWIKSPVQLKGYWHPDRGIVSANDAQGWFHTGDLGHIDQNGDLVLVGRKSAMIKTTGGKKIAPGPLEAALTQSQYIERAIIVGDGRPFPVGLIAPEVSSVEIWAQKQGLALPEQGAWHRGGAVFELIQQEIQKALDGQPNHNQIRSFYIFPAALSAEAGEITAGGKTRRSIIALRYKAAIDRLYSAS